MTIQNCGKNLNQHRGGNSPKLLRYCDGKEAQGRYSSQRFAGINQMQKRKLTKREKKAQYKANRAREFREEQGCTELEETYWGLKCMELMDSGQELGELAKGPQSVRGKATYKKVRELTLRSHERLLRSRKENGECGEHIECAPHCRIRCSFCTKFELEDRCQIPRLDARECPDFHCRIAPDKDYPEILEQPSILSIWDRTQITRTSKVCFNCGDNMYSRDRGHNASHQVIDDHKIWVYCDCGGKALVSLNDENLFSCKSHYEAYKLPGLWQVCPNQKLSYKTWGDRVGKSRPLYG